MTAPIPTPIGVGPAFHPPALSRAVSTGAPAGGFRCGDGRARFGVHLELFAAGRVVIVPAGIGVAPPWRRAGAYVRSGRCSYAARTREPTGVIEVSPAELTLGDFFAIWQVPLSATQVGPAQGPVIAYVNGSRDDRNPADIPLLAHERIQLNIGGDVPPYLFDFPPGD